MINLDELNHRELSELSLDLARRLKEFNAVRLKIRAKRCGKSGCSCAGGPADNAWGNLHGPYVFAQYVDNEIGKMRVVSLGRHYDLSDIIEDREKILDNWFDFFTVTPAEAEKIRDREGAWLHVHYLSPEEFYDFYGVEMIDDAMGRHTEYYAIKQKFEAYETVKRANRERRSALDSEWATEYGIGSIKGQRSLAQLLRGKYYLVTELTRD